MPSNFLVFDETGQFMMTDEQYEASPERENGVRQGRASTTLENKAMHQATIMAAAMGQFISNTGRTASDLDISNLTTQLTDALKSTGSQTGDGKDCWSVAAPSGWIFAYGTIGSALSNATNRANADCADLFEFFWDNYNNAQLAVFNSAGQTVTRGVSAAQDFANNRQIQIPDLRGRVRVALDNMGGVAANRVTAGASVGQGACDTLGLTAGQQTHTPTIAETAAHNHSSSNFFTQSSGPVANGSGNGRLTSNTDSTGGGQPFNVMQPWIGCNYVFKL